MVTMIRNVCFVCIWLSTILAGSVIIAIGLMHLLIRIIY